MGGFSVTDNAKETGVSSREAAAAEHTCRDDAVKGGFLERG